MLRKPRIYLDTSVIGGCFDREFEQESRQLLHLAEQGLYTLLISDLLAEELRHAPEPVRALFSSISPSCCEQIAETAEAAEMAELYLQAGVVPRASHKDARHIATATVARASLVVSWNFKDLVNVNRIRGFKSVNIREGYLEIDIRSPRELIQNE